MKLSPDDVFPGPSWSGSVVSWPTREPPELELTLTPLLAHAVATKTARQLNEAIRVARRKRSMPAVKGSNAVDRARWVTSSSHIPATTGFADGTPIVRT